MEKNCGNCKWWDVDNARFDIRGEQFCPCKFPLPISASFHDERMYEDEGKDCPTFKERK